MQPACWQNGRNIFSFPNGNGIEMVKSVEAESTIPLKMKRELSPRRGNHGE